MSDKIVDKDINIYEIASVNLDYMKKTYSVPDNSDVTIREFTLNANGKQYNGILNSTDNTLIFKALDYGNYTITCDNMLNLVYSGSNLLNSSFTLENSNDVIQITLTNTVKFSPGFNSIDFKNNKLNIQNPFPAFGRNIERKSYEWKTNSKN